MVNLSRIETVKIGSETFKKVVNKQLFKSETQTIETRVLETLINVYSLTGELDYNGKTLTVK